MQDCKNPADVYHHKWLHAQKQSDYQSTSDALQAQNCLTLTETGGVNNVSRFSKPSEALRAENPKTLPAQKVPDR